MGKLWTIEDLAEFLGVPVQTIYDWRTRGYGPLGMKVGRYVRYRQEDVVTWLNDVREHAG
jgi:predicted DNA-binding transcriptional regulator AlpA